MGTTVVSPQGGGDSSIGLIIGLVLAAGILAVVFIFGLPYLRDSQTQEQQPTNINVTVPSPVPSPAPEQPSGN